MITIKKQPQQQQKLLLQLILQIQKLLLQQLQKQKLLLQLLQQRTN